MNQNRSVNGLRGIAALSVVINHFIAAFSPSILSNNYIGLFPTMLNVNAIDNFLSHPLVSVFYNGEFAVIIFFYISGFVLTLPYFEKIDAQLILRKRLFSRYLRLNIPIFIAVLISYVFFKFNLYFIIDAAKLSGAISWATNFWPSKITLIEALKEASYQSIIFGRATLIPPLWTLKIEFFGSLFILTYYIVKPKDKNLIPLFFLILLIYLIYEKDSIYFYAIIFGSLISYIKSINFPKLLFFVLGLYFGGYQFNNELYSFLPNIILFGQELWNIKSLYNTIGAFFLFSAIVHGFGSKFILSNFIQFLGRISFPLYLIHFIVLCSLSSWYYISTYQSSVNIVINFSLYLIVCMLLAVFFEKWIDGNSIRLAKYFGDLLFKNKI